MESYPSPKEPRPSPSVVLAIMRAIPPTLLNIEPMHGTTSHGGRGGAVWAESLLDRLVAKGHDRGECEWALHDMVKEEPRLLAISDELPSQPPPFGSGRTNRSRFRLVPTASAFPRRIYIWPLDALWRWHERQLASVQDPTVVAKVAEREAFGKGPRAKQNKVEERHKLIDQLIAAGITDFDKIHECLKRDHGDVLVKNKAGGVTSIRSMKVKYKQSRGKS